MVKKQLNQLWHELIQEAQFIEGNQLGHLIENYLVLMLIRYTTEQQLDDEPLAISYLKSHEYNGFQKKTAIQNVGDRCLILSGLYPDITTNRSIDIDYLTAIGQTAYQDLHEIIQGDLTFNQMSQRFIMARQALCSMRSVANYQGNLMHRLIGNLPFD